MYPNPQQVSSTLLPARKGIAAILFLVSILGFILSPFILCIVNPPNTIVGLPVPCNGGHKLAGLFEISEIVEIFQGLDPSLNRA